MLRSERLPRNYMNLSCDHADVVTELARRIRCHVVRMTHFAKSSHLGSCFSLAEILAVLYAKVLKVDPTQAGWPDRDRLVISKGHASAALYAVLAESGFFPVNWLATFYQDGGRLPGHVTYGVPGVEVSTGALGHGLPIACGMALAAKRDALTHRVFTIISDGECDEGSTWEAALFAPHHKLDNLIVVVDYNKIQSLGSVNEVLALDPLAGKWSAFGWHVVEVDGHNSRELESTFAGIPFQSGRPSCIVAHTTKGRGVSFMEDKLLWHYRAPNDEELRQALNELEVK
jgi:transketolase